MLVVELPKKFTFVAEEIESGEWRLVFKEWFKPGKESLQSARNTVDLLREYFQHTEISSNVELDENECSIKYQLVAQSKENAFDYLCGELMANSNIGKFTLNQLLVGVAATAMGFSPSKSGEEK